MSASPTLLNDLVDKWLKGVEKSRKLFNSKDVLLGPLDTEIATTPYDVVYREGRIRLKHYRSETPKQKDIM